MPCPVRSNRPNGAIPLPPTVADDQIIEGRTVATNLSIVAVGTIWQPGYVKLVQNLHSGGRDMTTRMDMWEQLLYLNEKITTRMMWKWCKIICGPGYVRFQKNWMKKIAKPGWCEKVNLMVNCDSQYEKLTKENPEVVFWVSQKKL